MITRFIVYTSLLCMVLLTAYQYHNRTVAERGSHEAEAHTVSRAPLKAPAPENVPPEGHGDASQEVSASDIPDPAPAFPPTQPQAADRQKEVRAKAIGLFNGRDYNGALKLLKQVEDPDVGVLLGIGVCYFKLGDYQNSVSFLRKVLALDGNNFVALKIIAFAYYNVDDLDQSLTNAGKGLSVRSDAELQALYKRLGRERNARRGYTEESSSHFRILFDGYEHGSVDRQILGLLEDAYRTIGQQLDYFPPQPVTVILYTDRDFYDTTQAPQWSQGIYDGKIRVPVKGLGLQVSVMRKVLFHEYTHVLVHYLAHSCPLWINEGLAEYFSAAYPGKTGQVIPLRNIERSFEGLGGGNVTLAYWESYSAVSSLIEKYGLYRMKTLLEAFGTGEVPDAAFEDALGITYNRFISNWGKEADSSF
jgi:tetratricopeptide (TPR) repeat protein